MNTHATKYQSAIKQNKILPFSTTQIDLEGILISEINQTNTITFHLFVESKKQINEQINKQKSTETDYKQRTHWWLPEGGYDRKGNIGEGG